MGVKAQDLVGMKFGRLTVASLDRVEPRGHYFWRCRCECGAEIVARGSNLRRGTVKSCGCYRSDYMRESRTSHGKTRTPEYMVWRIMRDRCENTNCKSFHRYGGRGIVVCERWLIFENFLADMGERPTPNHSIERKDNNKGYSPDNCVWATTKQQGRNRSTNHVIEYQGERKTIAEFAEINGLPYHILNRRIRKGWDVERALTTPVEPRRKRHAQTN